MAESAVAAAIRCFYCACCGTLVRLCAQCDRGQITCGARCRALRRREGVRAAGRRYQQTRRGRHRHAARQRRYRERAAKKVTHHRSTPEHGTSTLPPRARIPVRGGPLRCDGCGRAVAPLVQRRWRSSRPVRGKEERVP
jgi:hypothetical protein